MRTTLLDPRSLRLLIALVLLPPFLGCSGGGGGGKSSPGTSPNHSDPHFYLSQPGVQSAIDATEAAGYSLNLYSEYAVNPPDIQGKYDFTGTTVIPASSPVTSGELTWSKQVGNMIATNFEQYFDFGYSAGISSYGEIIQGSGKSFTVYSHIRIDVDISGYGTCSGEMVVVMDGVKNTDQSIDLTLVSTVTKNLTPTFCTIEGVTQVLHLEPHVSTNPFIYTSGKTISSWFDAGSTMALNLNEDTICVNEPFTTGGARIQRFDTASGTLLGEFLTNPYTTWEHTIGLDFYDDIYLCSFDIPTQACKLEKFTPGGYLVSTWSFSLPYTSLPYTEQDLDIVVNTSSSPTIYVLCTDKRSKAGVVVLDRKGGVVDSWEATGFAEPPRKMCLDWNRSYLYMTGGTDAAVYMYGIEGAYLGSWGMGDLATPIGIDVSVYINLVVADFGDDDVKHFTGSELSQTISSYVDPWSGSTAFENVRDVQIDTGGTWLYVMDQNGIHEFYR